MEDEVRNLLFLGESSKQGFRCRYRISGFLQWDSYAATAFCMTEVLVAELIANSINRQYKTVQ